MKEFHFLDLLQSLNKEDCLKKILKLINNQKKLSLLKKTVTIKMMIKAENSQVMKMTIKILLTRAITEVKCFTNKLGLMGLTKVYRCTPQIAKGHNFEQAP